MIAARAWRPRSAEWSSAAWQLDLYGDLGNRDKLTRPITGSRGPYAMSRRHMRTLGKLGKLAVAIAAGAVWARRRIRARAGAQADHVEILLQRRRVPDLPRSLRPLPHCGRRGAHVRS